MNHFIKSLASILLFGVGSLAKAETCEELRTRLSDKGVIAAKITIHAMNTLDEDDDFKLPMQFNIKLGTLPNQCDYGTSFELEDFVLKTPSGTYPGLWRSYFEYKYGSYASNPSIEVKDGWTTIQGGTGLLVHRLVLNKMIQEIGFEDFQGAENAAFPELLSFGGANGRFYNQYFPYLSQELSISLGIGKKDGKLYNIIIRKLELVITDSN